MPEPAASPETVTSPALGTVQSGLPARVLGPIDALCVVIGGIIGVGIFFNPSGVANLVHSGPLALAAWALAGFIALCGALVFAELGGMYHAAGAQYEIVRDCYGSLAGFLYVFCVTTGIQAGAIGVIATVCATNLAVALGLPPLEGGSLLAVSCSLVVAVTSANIIGVKWGARIQNLTVFAKVFALAAVGIVAVIAGEHQLSEAMRSGSTSGAPAIDAAIDRVEVVSSAAASTSPGFGAIFAGILAALVPAFFAYGGWQQALWMAGEVRQPQRNVPRAIIIGVLIVIGVYLLANWSYLRLLGFDGVRDSKALAADAVSVAIPGAGARLVAATVAISAFGVLNAQLFTGPRLLFALSRDGRFFKGLSNLSPRFGTPVGAIVLLAAMALGLLLAAGFDGAERLINGVVFVDGVFFALTGAALVVLRRTRPDAPRSFRVPLYPLVPALFVIGEIGVLTGALLDEKNRWAALIGIGWIAAGCVLYAMMFRTRRMPAR